MPFVRRALQSGILAVLSSVVVAQVATGTVLGFDGQPVRGAVVSAGFRPEQRSCREVLTDERGGFEVAADAPLGWLRVQLEGVTVEVPLFEGGVSGAQVSFVGAAAFTLRGIMRTPDGEPAPFIDVLARDAEGGGLLNLATDVEGRFELRCGQAVRELVFDPIGWRHTIAGPFDRDREFAVELRDVASEFFVLQGRVLTDAAPAANELVRGIGTVRVVTTRTRGDGGYKLWANFPLARLQVPLALSIRRDGPFQVSATAVDLDSRVHGCVLVVGRFQTANGNPVARAAVFAHAEDAPYSPDVPASGYTDADGWFYLRLPRGTPLLHLEERGQWRGQARVQWDGAVIKVIAERW